MAICKACNQDMLLAEGCKEKTVIAEDGERLVRVPYTGEEDRCGDCGVKRGHVHHRDCEIEPCPRCGDIMIHCGCVPEEI